jgi:hypothetical protein
METATLKNIFNGIKDFLFGEEESLPVTYKLATNKKYTYKNKTTASAVHDKYEAARRKEAIWDKVMTYSLATVLILLVGVSILALI